MKKNKCPICKGEMKKGETDLTMRRERSVVVVESVPALVCQDCGEAVIDATTSQRVYEVAQEEIMGGTALGFRKYEAA